MCMVRREVSARQPLQILLGQLKVHSPHMLVGRPLSRLALCGKAHTKIIAILVAHATHPVWSGGTAAKPRTGIISYV